MSETEPLRRELPYDADEERVSFVRLGSVLLRHRRAILRLPLVFAVIAVVVTLILPATYTSTASFLPQSDNVSVSQLSGLAASLGFRIPAGESGESPEFYVALLSSRELLDSTVDHSYVIAGDDGATERRGTLIDFYRIGADSRPEQLLEARKRLSEDLRAVVQTEVGMVQVFYESRSPDLAQQVLARVIERVNDFNLRARQSQAGEERRFVEGRLEQARIELEEAEDRMSRFLAGNRRGWDTSPELQFEYGRLQRQVALREAIHGSLAESYETARIDEVRNTPVITMVDHPALPPRPDKRNLILKAVLAAIIGLLVAVLYAVTSEFLRGARAHDPGEFAEFVHLRDETVGEFRSFWSRLRRRGA